jgi:hypothetical protein
MFSLKKQDFLFKNKKKFKFLDRSTNIVSQLISPNPSKKTPTIMEENEIENHSIPSSPLLSKPKISVERLSMSQLDSKSSHNRHPIKVPSHIFTRRSPDVQKHLRAKTVRIGKIRWPPPLNPEDVDNANQQRLDFLQSNISNKLIFRRMLVQRRIQEEIHGNKTIQNEIRQTNGFHECSISEKISPVERKTPIGRCSQSDEKFVDQQKKSPITNISIDRLSPLSNDDDDMSTNEIIARNQSSKLDFHKTMTPMIGKENFELRKKLFEHPDESSFAGKLINH